MSKYKEWFENSKIREMTFDMKLDYEENGYIFTKFVKMVLFWRFVVWKGIFLLAVTVLAFSYLYRVFPLAENLKDLFP